MPVLRSSSRLQITPSGAGSPRRRSQLANRDIDSSPSKSSSPRRTRDKGKGASTPMPKPLRSNEIIEISSEEESEPRQSAIIADLRRQISKLKDENAKHRRDLEKYKRESSSSAKSLLDMAKIEDNLHCEICTMRLWSPYVLPGCGHIFCQSCLHDWFTTILTKFNSDRPGHQQHPNLMIRVSQPFGALNTPPYSCPTCRVAVSMKPAEVYALKAIVRAAASVAGEKSPQKNTSERSIRKRHNYQSSESVWDRFFPMQKA